MRNRCISNLILATAVALAGCGDSENFVVTGNGAAPPASGTVIVNHTLFRAVPGRVDEKTFTGTDSSGQVTYGPVTFDKAPSIQLDSVPVTTTNLKIEYIDVDPEPDVKIGEHNESSRDTLGILVIGRHRF